MNKKILILVFVGLFLIGFISATEQGLGTVKRGVCISLRQTYANSTWQNISTVLYPETRLPLLQGEYGMTKSGISFNYTLCTTNDYPLGQYIVEGHGDKDGVDESWSYDFYLTEGGEQFSTPQAVMLLGIFGMVGLFFGIGLTFKKEKWKLRSFFFICALLMGVIFLNSIRIIIGTSTNLAKMGSVGLILGIVILLFMFLYSFIHYTLEAFKYFKEKRRMKWNI